MRVTQARVAAVLLLTVRGTPTMHYGDEIGMVNVPVPPESVHDPVEKRLPGIGMGPDPQRALLQWSERACRVFRVGTLVAACKRLHDSQLRKAKERFDVAVNSLSAVDRIASPK